MALSHGLAKIYDQRVISLYGCEPPMVSHHSAKFSCYTHCGSENLMLQVMKSKQIFLKFAIAVHTKAHNMSILVVQYWSHVPKITTEGK